MADDRPSSAAKGKRLACGKRGKDDATGEARCSAIPPSVQVCVHGSLSPSRATVRSAKSRFLFLLCAEHIQSVPNSNAKTWRGYAESRHSMSLASPTFSPSGPAHASPTTRALAAITHTWLNFFVDRLDLKRHTLENYKN